MIHRRFYKIFSALWNVSPTVNRSNFVRTNFHFNNKHEYGDEWFWRQKKPLYFIATVGYLTYYFNNNKRHAYAKGSLKFSTSSTTCPPGPSGSGDGSVTPPHLAAPRIPQRPDLPTYTKAQVATHQCREDGIWVTYQNGVYDITKFIDKHPGGDQIKMAAGKPCEGFFWLSLVHYKPHVLELFEEYRIGNLRQEDVQTEFKKREIYKNQPTRDPKLIPLTKEPFNAGPPPDLLRATPMTPNELHFIRTHGPVPNIDMSKYCIEVVVGNKKKTLSLSLDELKKFPKHSVNMTLMCAGCRRDEMNEASKHKKGLLWTFVAAGNAVYGGAKLSDILEKAGFTDADAQENNHVCFEAFDTDFRGMNFSMSIPLWKAIDKKGEVIVAYEMNGSDIPPDHGYPVKVIVPGFAGARCVKWLKKITVQPEVDKSFNQQRLYKSFSPNVYYHNLDWDAAPPVDELPVTSAILCPLNGGNVKACDGKIAVSGYAYSGGGQRIIRVDVSTDEGANWHTAKFTYQTDTKPPQHYSWTLWTCDVPIAKGSKSCNIWVKAVDSSYNTQPERFEHIWNLRGVICNAYHKIKVNVE